MIQHLKGAEEMGIEALVGKSPARRGFNKVTTADHLKLAVKTAQSPLDFVFHLDTSSSYSHAGFVAYSPVRVSTKHGSTVTTDGG